jgi:hypothetical protein
MVPIASRVLRCCAALWLMVAGLDVTAGAQSPAQPLVARTYLEEDDRSAPLLLAAPANIVVPAGYRETIESMLRSSATFRRQCGRIARDTTLHVVIERSLLPASAGTGALTRITRRSDGGLDAAVEVGYLGEPILLIAHEFEHILEQLDGVDLPSMAARPATGVHAVSSSGHFETDRAIAAGEQVAREVFESGRRRGA